MTAGGRDSRGDRCLFAVSRPARFVTLPSSSRPSSRKVDRVHPAALPSVWLPTSRRSASRLLRSKRQLPTPVSTSSGRALPLPHVQGELLPANLPSRLPAEETPHQHLLLPSHDPLRRAAPGGESAGCGETHGRKPLRLARRAGPGLPP